MTKRKRKSGILPKFKVEKSTTCRLRLNKDDIIWLINHADLGFKINPDDVVVSLNELLMPVGNHLVKGDCAAGVDIEWREHE